jgi:2-polyprenyl-6-methoxyphenol hydroxylase-like FAD-dependent oxidoreductase
MLPVGFRWAHKKVVTLLGDAAPFSGVGVNTTFYDAMLLAKEIGSLTRSDECMNLDEHVALYEKKLHEHAHKAQVHTEGSMDDMLFTPGAPRTSIESWILRHAKEVLPTWTHSILTVIIYAGYWVYKMFA